MNVAAGRNAYAAGLMAFFGPVESNADPLSRSISQTTSDTLKIEESRPAPCP